MCRVDLRTGLAAGPCSTYTRSASWSDSSRCSPDQPSTKPAIFVCVHHLLVTNGGPKGSHGTQAARRIAHPTLQCRRWDIRRSGEGAPFTDRSLEEAACLQPVSDSLSDRCLGMAGCQMADSLDTTSYVLASTHLDSYLNPFF